MDLILPVKRKWFEQVKSGEKDAEFRLNNDYWKKRLIGKTFDRVIITLGYPKADDATRHLYFRWSGYEMRTVVSEEWNNIPQDCFAILLNPLTKRISL